MQPSAEMYESSSLSTANDDMDWSMGSFGTFDVESGVEFYHRNERKMEEKRYESPCGVQDSAVNKANIPAYVEYRKPSLCTAAVDETRAGNNRYCRERMISFQCEEEKCSSPTLPEDQMLQLTLAENRFISEQLRPYLVRSAMSQEALHQWDKKLGLPASHARTMLRSKRTRDQLLEGAT